MIGILSGLKIKLIVGVILLAVLSGGYFYVQKLQSDVTVLEQNQETLKDAVKTQDLVIDQMTKNIEIITKRTNALQKGLQTAQEDAINRTKVFKEKDVKEITRQNPTLVEKEINQGAIDVFKKLENVTGGNTIR